MMSHEHRENNSAKTLSRRRCRLRRKKYVVNRVDTSHSFRKVAPVRHQPQKKPRRRPAGKRVHGPPPPSCDVRLAAHGCCESERSHSQTDFTCGAHALCALVVELAPSRQETVTSECENGRSALFCGSAASLRVLRRTPSGPLTGPRHPPVRLYNVHLRIKSAFARPGSLGSFVLASAS